jgi:opacity protein-like surface antigen
MNKSLIILPITLLSGAVIAAEALNEGAYLSIGVGASKTQNWKSNAGLSDAAFKTGINARVAVGHRFCNFRAEFEPSYIDLHKKADDNALGITGHMRTLSALGNVYYHFPTLSSVAPYIGVGAGFSSIKALYRGTPGGGPKEDISATKFAYQGIVGASFALNEDTSLNLDYRYFQTEKLNQVDRGVRNHSINLGLSYFF